jgi:hypothetical protein
VLLILIVGADFLEHFAGAQERNAAARQDAFLSPYFITNAEKMRVEMEDPYVLIYEKKLSPFACARPSVREYGLPVWLR